VSVDDYQFMDATTEGLAPVPNADKDFGQGFAAGKTLISKSDNDEVYSALIKKSANSTQNWLASIQAIEAYCVGKTPDKIQSAGTDAVSGATLVDTNGYLKLIAQVAQDDTITVQGTYTGDGSDLKLGRTNAACHGTKAFGDAVSLVQGSTLVATNIDEFQFFDATTAGLTPVPNSDKGLRPGLRRRQGARLEGSQQHRLFPDDEGKGPGDDPLARFDDSDRERARRQERRPGQALGSRCRIGRHARRHRRLRQSGADRSASGLKAAIRFMRPLQRRMPRPHRVPSRDGGRAV
jgi:hypothetical protein